MSNNKKTKLTDEDLEVLEKLKIMMSKKGIVKEDLEKNCFFSHSKVKSYLDGQRRITEKYQIFIILIITGFTVKPNLWMI